MLACGDEKLELCRYQTDSLTKLFNKFYSNQITKTKFNEIKRDIATYINTYPGSLREKARLCFDYYVTSYQLEKAETFVNGMIPFSAISSRPDREIEKNKKVVEYIRYKIQKQISKINRDLRPYLIGQSIFDRYFNIWFTQTSRDLKLKESTIHKNQVHNFLLRILGMIPDMYLFSRMFKHFDKKDEDDTHCGKQLYPKNIIVYGGYIHMIIMSELIKDIFKTEPSIIKQVDPKVGCLEFEDPIQFF